MRAILRTTAALQAMQMLSVIHEVRQIPAPRKVQTCNLSEEEIAERDRPISRQERRQIERLKRKGRA